MDGYVLNDDAVSENGMEKDAELKLDIDDLNWQGEQTTSLCDRFQIHMFTEEFEYVEDVIEQEEYEDKQEIFGYVMDEAGNVDENEQIFSTVMATETELIIKANYTEEAKSGLSIWAFIYVMCGISVAGIVLWLIEYRRKRK